MVSDFPRGFLSFIANAGIQDKRDDFLCLYSTTPCQSAALFTRNSFPGISITLSKAHAVSGCNRGLIVVSKNANVATGNAGAQDAKRLLAAVAKNLGTSAEQWLLASTGVIGYRYPIARIERVIERLRGEISSADFPRAASAIMTTDTKPKIVSTHIGNARLVGIAKGAGMIAPNMATLLVFFFTDARLEEGQLAPLFRRVIDHSFNRLSIDGDCSTSDMAAILANGAQGLVASADFESALLTVAEKLAQSVLRDGEGVTRLMRVVVEQASDVPQAEQIARSIAESLLVKTALHGADPNWGRIAMAIGKHPDPRLDSSKLCIALCGVTVYPEHYNEQALAQKMRADSVEIRIQLGLGTAQYWMLGCDLSAEYLRINSAYRS